MIDETPLTEHTQATFPAGMRTTADWVELVRILVGFSLIYLVFDRVATWTGSLNGESGALVCGLVVATTLLVERLLFGTPYVGALRSLGIRRSDWRGLLVAAAICGLLLGYYPIFAALTGVRLSMREGWPILALGIVLQGGVAEELLWRGYLFGRLRRRRGFWQAAAVSMLVMAITHLLLFATLPFLVALAATLVAVVISFPLCQLYALGGDTIWGPALVHAVVQGAIKLVVFPVELQLSAQIVWMVLCVVLPLLAFVFRRTAP